MKKSLSRIPRGGGASYVVFVLIVLFITIYVVLSRSTHFSRHFWTCYQALFTFSDQWCLVDLFYKWCMVLLTVVTDNDNHLVWNFIHLLLHQITVDRLQVHLVKCRKNHPGYIFF